jgi:hypothetical protein
MTLANSKIGYCSPVLRKKPRLSSTETRQQSDPGHRDRQLKAQAREKVEEHRDQDDAFIVKEMVTVTGQTDTPPLKALR